MLRSCNGSDPNLIGKDGNSCSCGLTFDDVYHLVVYPHTKFEMLDISEIDKIHQLYNRFIQEGANE